MGEVYSLGDWIRRRRKALDLTQSMLAERVGCSVDLIQKIETDARRPSRETAARLASTLGLAGEEHAAFVQAARAAIGPDRLAPPTASVVIPPVAPTPAPPVVLPSGTVTFLFTDIAGSSRLWEQHPQAMPNLIARHDELLGAVVAAHGGAVFKTMGDSVLAAFAIASAAVAAALAAQRAIVAEPWGLPEPVLVRMALHSGAAELREGDYHGPTLNRAARLLTAGHGGQMLLSLVTAQLAREQLPQGAGLRDLGSHQLKDLSQPEQVFQLLAPDLPADFPALNTLAGHNTNLPASLTALLGREQEVAALTALLSAQTPRLVTLTGPGGIGKTRLSLQVAAELLDDFTHGVYFADLAPVRLPEQVISAIATTLGVREIGGEPLFTSLKDYLRAKHLLLVLDNFEQVLDAAPQLAELLAAAPRLKALVTSREALHLRGEREVLLAPLAFPDWAALPPLEQLSQYAAVALFIERAAEHQPGFAVTNANAPAVAEICVRLDGLPLALELAAARVKLFPPEALVARLSSRLTLLTGGPRDLPARQQTIRATIAWSYDLLDETEQTLFRRLGVFVGGFTLEAAEAVCGLTMMDRLAALLDKSLLRSLTAGEEPRFSMLETIREFAIERLAICGEAEAVGRRHAEYYLALAETAAPHLQRGAQLVWLERLDAEQHNVRMALTWARQVGDTELGLRLASALELFWVLRNHDYEGWRWLAQTLVERDHAVPAVRARALCVAGRLALHVGDMAAAGACLAESLSLYRSLEDRRGIARTLGFLAWQAFLQGDLAQMQLYLGESEALYRALDDSWGIAYVLLCKPMIADKRDDHLAALEESLARFQQEGDRWGIGAALNNLGLAVWEEGDDERAKQFFEHYHQISRELGNDSGIHSNLGWIAVRQGDLPTAAMQFSKVLQKVHARNLRSPIAECLAGMGTVMGLAGQPEQAAQLLGASEALFAAIDQVLDVEHSGIFIVYTQAVASVRSQLSDTAFERAYAAGHALSVEAAVDNALDWLTEAQRKGI
jgi:predicted ATPase/class 3 adenylate cyclase